MAVLDVGEGKLYAESLQEESARVAALAAAENLMAEIKL